MASVPRDQLPRLLLSLDHDSSVGLSCDSSYDLWLLRGFSSLSSYYIMQHIQFLT